MLVTDLYKGSKINYCTGKTTRYFQGLYVLCNFKMHMYNEKVQKITPLNTHTFSKLSILMHMAGFFIWDLVYFVVPLLWA